METVLALKDLYVGTEPPSRYSHGERYHVLGTQFGPMLLCANASLEDALDEWDERYGERVDVVIDRTTLTDYDGATAQEQIESAMNCGDIRINSGGTMVWVDHYEWVRSFRTGREAGRYFRTCMDR